MRGRSCARACVLAVTFPQPSKAVRPARVKRSAGGRPEDNVLTKSVVLQLVVEPSGAVGLAAVLSPKFKEILRGQEGGLQNVGIILSGGNVDLAAAGLWENLLVAGYK